MTTRRRGRFGLAIATIAAVLGVWEVGLRTQHARNRPASATKAAVASENRDLMWEFRPNSIRGYKSRDADGNRIAARINRWGFRDRDYPSQEKSGGVFRVAFLGDSVVEGMDVHLESTLVRQFERLANGGSSRRQVEAMNFGVSGYNAPQVAEVLETRAMDFAPDLLVYVMHLNDFDFDDASARLIDHFARPRSHLWTEFRRRLRSPRQSSEDNVSYYFRLNHRTVYATVSEMRAFSDQHETPFVVALLPEFRTEDAPVPCGFYPYGEIHAEIVAELRGDGVHVIDLLDYLANGEGPCLTEMALNAGDPWHPNALGHGEIARTLHEQLRYRLPR